MVRAFGSAVVVGEFGSLDGLDEVSIFGSWAARYSGEPGASRTTLMCSCWASLIVTTSTPLPRRAEQRIGLAVNTTIRRRDARAEADDSFARQIKSSATLVVSAAGSQWWFAGSATLSKSRHCSHATGYGVSRVVGTPVGLGPSTRRTVIATGHVYTGSLHARHRRAGDFDVQVRQ